MPRRTQRARKPDLRLILDSSAVIAESRGNPRLRAFLKEALLFGGTIIVPVIVVAETYRGDSRDVGMNRLLNSVIVPTTDITRAQEAGRLLSRVAGAGVADALVVAEAVRYSPCTVLTSDLNDILRLVNGHSDITVVRLDEL